MWREALTRGAGAALAVAALVVGPIEGRAADRLSVGTLVTRLAGPQNLGVSVSTILSLRLWTTLRPRPAPGAEDRDFGAGQIGRSGRVIGDGPEEALGILRETRSQMVLWGSVEEYGEGVVATANVVIEPPRPGAATPRTWRIAKGKQALELDLPSLMYQFSPLILEKALVARYSRPDQIRLCQARAPDCGGVPLQPPYRAIRQEASYALVRQYGGRIGWVYLPDLASAEGEVVGMVAALISYLRGDFEQAETFFARVAASNAESLVRNDARLLAAVSGFRFRGAIDPLRAAQEANRYSRFGAQALVMAELGSAVGAADPAVRRDHARRAKALLDAYRHLFTPADRWPRTVDEILPGLG